MFSVFPKHIFLSCKILLYAAVLCIFIAMFPSCSGSKKSSSSMRQIEKHAKKYPVDDVTGQPVASRGSSSKKVRQALANQEKQKAAAEKEQAKAQRDAITRHRSLQTQETRDRMDRNLKEANKRHRTQKEFFAVRWFRPKDDIEKMEKRQAKEVQKRMAATRKQADKNNKDMGMSRTAKTKKEVKRPLPSPNDMPQGGGGVYKAGSSRRYASPNNVQHGGGGVYRAGSSRNNVSPNNVQQGGGGSYAESSSRNRLSSSDFQQGGGGTYQTGRSNRGVKASDFQQGGGGKMPKESRRSKRAKK